MLNNPDKALAAAFYAVCYQHFACAREKETGRVRCVRVLSTRVKCKRGKLQEGESPNAAHRFREEGERGGGDGGRQALKGKGDQDRDGNLTVSGSPGSPIARGGWERGDRGGGRM